jgi:hypothetical protein
MKNAIKTLDFQGTGIQFSADGWLNATATVAALNKAGLENFLRSAAYLDYAQVVAEASSVDITDLKKTVTGKGKDQGTFLHPDMAVVFARWISPAFAYWCDKQVAALIQKAQAAPALAEQARTKRLQKMGVAAPVIAMRNEGVSVRLVFTNRLQRHGVAASGFRACTAAIYFPMFGGSTDVIKEKYSLPKKANVRDYMNLTQLSAISFAEALAAERIEKEGIYGNLACEQACNQVGQAVAKMVVDTRRGLAA